MTQLANPQTETAAAPAVQTAPRAGIVIGHSHWDREWYLPFEGFRTRLVAMLDGLIEMLERDPEFRSFLLDGQAIMLEDYLQVRPEMEERVRRLVEAGRIKVGPWYTATDTLLPDPEAIVRNLELGRWMTRRLGGEPLKVGYMPDLFGFSAQIPQILNQFGIENSVAWRGLHPDNGSPICWWYSPDGSRLLNICMDYSESAVGVVDPERFLREHLPGLIEKQNRGPFKTRLFLMGSDHFIASARLPWVARQIAEQVGHPVKVGSLEEIMELIRAEAEIEDAPKIYGEQRDSCLVICPASVAGTRIPLKRANQQVEAALLGEAEPLQALAAFAGAGSDLAHLRWAWRLVTQNHPHDSIPGCSIDEVHREMMTRFAQAAMVIKDAAQRGAKRLARALDPATRGELGAVGIVSLTGGQNRLRVRLHGPEEGVPVFRVVEQDGREVPFSVTGRGHQYVQYHRLQDAFATNDATTYIQIAAPKAWVDEKRNRPQMMQLPWVEIELELDAPKAGYRVLRLEKGARWPVQPKTATGPGTPEISNDLLRVWAGQSGLFVEDRRNGRTYGPIYFTHTGERGDEYTACPVPGTTFTFAPQAAKARVVRQGLVDRLEIPVAENVPARLTADRTGRTGQVRLNGKIALTLLGGRVDLKLELDNQALNYDLRLVARVNGAVRAACGAPFAVEQRSFEPPHLPEKPAQLHLPDFPFRGWVALNDDGGAGLAVLARGLYEAAATRSEGGAEIRLTLLRGVDALSRKDLYTRPEHAGPMIMTPDAQCLGRHAWEVAFLPFGQEEAENIPAQAERFLRPAQAFPVQWSAGKAPGERSLFAGDDKLVITTLKPASEGEGTIVHAFNPTANFLFAQVQAEGQRVRLDETPRPGSTEVAPFEIAAWRVKAE